MKYAAFISYRHLPRDARIAKQVQRAIEHARLPRGVASACASDKRRLGRVFRDEDELAAEASLPDRIHAALEQSGALIVVCTPATPQSAWVEREIACFIEAHGHDRVFAVLADGSSSESIPAMLKTREEVGANGSMREVACEPLAADLRPQACSRKRVELLRIVAAVAATTRPRLRRTTAKTSSLRMRLKRSMTSSSGGGNTTAP